MPLTEAPKEFPHGKIEKTIQHLFTALGSYPLGADYQHRPNDPFFPFRTPFKTPVAGLSEFEGTHYDKFWIGKYDKKFPVPLDENRGLDDARVKHLPNASLYMPYKGEDGEIRVVTVGEGYLDERHTSEAFGQLTVVGAPVFLLHPQKKGGMPSEDSEQAVFDYLSDEALALVNNKNVTALSGKQALASLCYGIEPKKIAVQNNLADNLQVPDALDLLVGMLNNLVKSRIGTDVIERVISKVARSQGGLMYMLQGSMTGFDIYFDAEQDFLPDIESGVAGIRGVTHESLAKMTELTRESVVENMWKGKENHRKEGEDFVQYADEQLALRLLGSALAPCGVKIPDLIWFFDKWDKTKKQFHPESTKRLLRGYLEK